MMSSKLSAISKGGGRANLPNPAIHKVLEAKWESGEVGEESEQLNSKLSGSRVESRRGPRLSVDFSSASLVE
jgi:hypothetical protein